MFQIVMNDEELMWELDYFPLKLEELQVGIPYPAIPMLTSSHTQVFWQPMPGVH